MATVIIAATVFVLASANLLLILTARNISIRQSEMTASRDAFKALYESERRTVNRLNDEVTELMRQKQEPHVKTSRTESVFGDGDKIPDRKPTRYVSIAARRAAAEQAARKGQDHAGQVRDNNARAMEKV